MPRYIDLDKVIKDVESVGAYYSEEETVKENCLFEIKGQPIADVVPRSEVEQLQRNLEQCENGYRQQIHIMECKHKDEVEKAKQEVARKIFEDFTKHKVCTNEEDYRVLAELKKKHIGE